MRALPLVLLLLAAPALAQRAEILWDRYGVPHVYAADDEALAFALAWAQMEAHGDALLRLVGQARARAAAYWGAGYREADRRLLTLGAEALARRLYEDLPAAERHRLEAFAEGANAWAAAHSNRVTDSLRAVLPLEGLDVLRRAVHAHLLFTVPDLAGGLPWLPGSNAWAVAGRASASGHALLLANPHLPWTDPYRFMEVRLAAPGLDVYGVTFLGFPVVTIGFTPRHGWTHTVSPADGADRYAVELAEGGYVFDGAVRAFEADTLALAVRQPDGSLREEPLVVRRTVHGPVVAERDGRALALRLPTERLGLAFAQWERMARAPSMEAFEEALRLGGVTGFTTTYADRDGNVLHHAGAGVPRRPRPDRAFWAGTVPGDDPALLWTDTHAYDEMPRVANPPSGFVQNANEASWWATWPSPLDPAAFPGTFGSRAPSARAQRSLTLLAEAAPMTFEDLVARRLDSRSLLADALVPDLVAAARAHGPEIANRAADVLEAWDRTLEAESRGGVLFQAWLRSLRARTGGALFARPWRPSDPLRTPAGLAEPALAAAVLAEAAADLEARYGALDVPWGTVHRLRHAGLDLPASGGPADLGVFRVAHFVPRADGRAAAVHGDTFVLAVAFAPEGPRAEAVLVYGNTSVPGSPHAADQLALAAEGRLRAVRLDRAAVEADGGRRTVVLQ